jgi:hypothetical protein
MRDPGQQIVGDTTWLVQTLDFDRARIIVAASEVEASETYCRDSGIRHAVVVPCDVFSNVLPDAPLP